MKIQTTLKALSLALAASLASTVAHAQIVVRDWQVAGDSSLTYDATSNLEWLDLSLTFNTQIAPTVVQLGTGGLFEGFRLATATEVHGLMTNAGVPTSLFSDITLPTPTEWASMTNLTNLLGETVGRQFGPQFNGSRGFVLQNAAPLLVGFYQDLELSDAFGTEVGFNDYALTTDALTGTGSGAGIWLVRSATTGPITPVPEPSTYGLIGAGALLGLALYRRRK